MEACFLRTAKERRPNHHSLKKNGFYSLRREIDSSWAWGSRVPHHWWPIGVELPRLISHTPSWKTSSYARCVGGEGVICLIHWGTSSCMDQMIWRRWQEARRPHGPATTATPRIHISCVWGMTIHGFGPHAEARGIRTFSGALPVEGNVTGENSRGISISSLLHQTNSWIAWMRLGPGGAATTASIAKCLSCESLKVHQRTRLKTFQPLRIPPSEKNFFIYFRWLSFSLSFY